MALTRNQKQIVLLSILLGAIVVVLAFFVFRPAPAVPEPAYVPPAVEPRIPAELLQRPEYRQLELRVQLPLVPGRVGRENPFEPY